MSRSSRNLRVAGAHPGLARLTSTPGPASPIDRLREAWVAVAPRAAAHSSPERLSRAGVATVACSHAGWAQELSAHAAQLLARIGEHAPDLAVRQLRFSVAAGPPRHGREAPRIAPAPVRPGPADLASAASAVVDVEDPELRETLRRAVAAGLALQRNIIRRGAS